VTALIALLAALLLPVMAQVRGSARRTLCLAHMRQIAQAHQLYLADFDERFPPWRFPDPSRATPCGANRFWTEFLQPYLRSEAVLRDPGAAGEAPPTCAKLADYALMTWSPEDFMRMAGSGAWDDPYFRFPGPPLSLAEVVRPVETVRITDGWTSTGASQGRLFRHLGGTNAAFVDGHVRWLRVEETRRVETDGRGFHWLHYGTADR
jgi:prepilin-type processing-associated H-X9-DG protein